MQIEFNAAVRKSQGTGASRRLRRAGRVPGILYGGQAAPQAIELDHNEIFQHLRKEAFYSSVLNMQLGQEKQMCLLRDVQRHPYKPLILHVDFQRIDATQKIHQKVPLHFVNAEIAPGVKLSGGMVQHVLTELDVRCLPKDLPGYIEVDLKDLAAGSSVKLSELKVPTGVEVVTHKNDDPVVATILVRGGATEEAEAAEPVETQVINEKKPAATEEKKADAKKPEAKKK